MSLDESEFDGWGRDSYCVCTMTTGTSRLDRFVRFGDFELDPDTHELRRRGIKVKLQEQPYRILTLLLERRGGVVSREELREQLWPEGTFVDFEHGLNTAVKRLRDTLDDSAANPRFIETIPRRGYRFAYPVEFPTRLPRPKGGWRRLQFGLIAAAVAVLTSNFLYRHYETDELPRIQSVAVLPFENLTRSAEHEYFADGVTDAITTELGEGGFVRVISRRSATRYRNTRESVPSIAKTLGVDAIVEGSVLRDNDRVSITAKLVRASPEAQLWAGSYDGDIADVIKIQRSIAQEIATDISSHVAADQYVAKPRRVNAAAHEALLRGGHALGRGRSETSLDAALAYFQKSVEIDPFYAPAYAGLANSYNNLGFWGYRPRIEMAEKARVAASRALELDPRSVDALTALAFIEQEFDWDWVAAERNIEKALKLNPNHADAHVAYLSYLTFMGRFDEAIATSERQVLLDPLSPWSSVNLGWTYFYARRYDAAIAEFTERMRREPDFPYIRVYLAASYAMKGDYDRARQECSEVLRLLPLPRDAPTLGTVGWVLAVTGQHEQARELLNEAIAADEQGKAFKGAAAHIYTGLGEVESALDCLEAAYAQRSSFVIVLKTSPMLDELRDEPRFRDLMQRMGFP